MTAAFRHLFALLMPWRANYTPYPVSGPYQLAAGEIMAVGAAAAEIFVTGTISGQSHEH